MATYLTTDEIRQGSYGFFLNLDFNISGFLGSYLGQSWRVRIVNPEGTVISKTSGVEVLSNFPRISVPIAAYELILAGTYYYQVTLITEGVEVHSSVESFSIEPSLPENLDYEVISSSVGYFPIFSSGGGLAQSTLNIDIDGDLNFSSGGAKFNGQVLVEDDEYDINTWDGNFSVPTKNAIRDAFQTLTVSAAGLTGQIQFNSGGNFAASNNLKFTSNNLEVLGTVSIRTSATHLSLQSLGTGAMFLSVDLEGNTNFTGGSLYIFDNNLSTIGNYSTQGDLTGLFIDSLGYIRKNSSDMEIYSSGTLSISGQNTNLLGTFNLYKSTDSKIVFLGDTTIEGDVTLAELKAVHSNILAFVLQDAEASVGIMMNSAQSSNPFSIMTESREVLMFVTPSGHLVVPNDPYDPDWETLYEVPTKSDIFSIIENLADGLIIGGDVIDSETNRILFVNPANKLAQSNNLIFEGDYLGLGTVPSYRLDVSGNTRLLGALGINTSPTLSDYLSIGGTTSTSGRRGINVDLTTTATSGAGYGIYSKISQTTNDNPFNYLRSIYGVATNIGKTVYGLVGLEGSAYNNTSPAEVAVLFGLKFSSVNEGTVNSSQYGISIDVFNNNTVEGTFNGIFLQLRNNTGTVGDAYGINLSEFLNTGTIANFYGIYADTTVGSGTISGENYMFYILSNIPSYFAGSIGIGTSANLAKLHIESASGEQLRVGYDESAYGSWQVMSDGSSVFSCSANEFIFNGTVGSNVDDAYNATTWDGNLDFPTKNSLRDKLESSLAIGGILGGATEGSVLFVGASGAISQSNKLKFDGSDLSLINPTSATALNQTQNSPYLHLQGSKWRTDNLVSEDMKMRLSIKPTSTNAASILSPTLNLEFWSQGQNSYQTALQYGVVSTDYLKTRLVLANPAYSSWGGMLEMYYDGSYQFKKLDGSPAPLTFTVAGDTPATFPNFGSNGYRAELRSYFGGKILFTAGAPGWAGAYSEGQHSSGTEFVQSNIPITIGGTLFPTSALEIINDAIEHLKLGYNSSNYFTALVESNADILFDLIASTGTPVFKFNKEVDIKTGESSSYGKATTVIYNTFDDAADAAFETAYFMSYSLPTDSMANNGHSIRGYVSGEFTSSGVRTINVSFAGQTIFTKDTINSISGAWKLEIEVTRKTSSTAFGTVTFTHFNTEGSRGPATEVDIVSMPMSSIDFEDVNDFVVSVDSDTSLSMYSKHCWVESLPKV